MKQTYRIVKSLKIFLITTMCLLSINTHAQKKIKYIYDRNTQNLVSIEFNGEDTKSRNKSFNVEDNNPYKKLKYAKDKKSAGTNEELETKDVKLKTVLKDLSVKYNDSIENIDIPYCGTYTYAYEGADKFTVLTYNFNYYDNDGFPVAYNSTALALNSQGKVLWKSSDNVSFLNPVITENGKYLSYNYEKYNYDKDISDEIGYRIIDVENDKTIIDKQVDNKFYLRPQFIMDGMLIILMTYKNEDHYTIVDFKNHCSYSKIYSSEETDNLTDITSEGFVFKGKNKSGLDKYTVVFKKEGFK